MKKINTTGLTVIELMVATAIIAIIAVIIYVAVNPEKRIAKANNTERWKETTAILNAILDYTIDNNGNYPAVIDKDSSTVQVLGTAVSGCNDKCLGVTAVKQCVDLTSSLVKNNYIAAIPSDPTKGSTVNTGYYINREATGRFIVGACNPQVETGITIPVIEVAR